MQPVPGCRGGEVVARGLGDRGDVRLGLRRVVAEGEGRAVDRRATERPGGLDQGREAEHPVGTQPTGNLHR